MCNLLLQATLACVRPSRVCDNNCVGLSDAMLRHAGDGLRSFDASVTAVLSVHKQCSKGDTVPWWRHTSGGGCLNTNT